MSAAESHRSPRIVAIGASAGGVEALRTIAAGLPPDFACPLLVVLHIGSHPSILPKLLTAAGALGASHATHGEELRPGHFHVAPPDRHMLIDAGRIVLSKGAKEHHARPAIDPTLRSAALAFGSRMLGAILSGRGEDGTAGLKAIEECGGVTLVEDPANALFPDMPASAARHVHPDRIAPLGRFAASLVELAALPVVPRRAEPPAPLIHEHQLFLAKGAPMEHLQAIGKPSTFACPECRGVLWELAGSDPVRFRCHTGHGYTLRTLQHSQAEATDETLWSAIRALQEEELIMRRMAAALATDEGPASKVRLDGAADRLAAQVAKLRALAGDLQTDPARALGGDT